jgi:hypothetical protein
MPSALRQAAARGARVVSVCTGAFALAAVGLLDNRQATTHWQYAADLAARHPEVKVDPDRLWVDEGSVLTSAGLAAGIDLCVQLVRADYGSDAAIDVARYMVVAPHRDGGQAQLLQRPVPPPAESLAATCDWALEHLAEPLTVADLARHAGWAPSTFARASWPRPAWRHSAGSRPQGCGKPVACSRSATSRSTTSPPAAAWAAPPTCACIWRATPGRRPPPTGPPTRAAIRVPEAHGIGWAGKAGF